MQKGFNSDIQYMGGMYHIQTEDWGQENPYLVTRVFRDGAVLKSIKTSYTDVMPTERDRTPQTIRMALQFQHKKILDLLLSGQLLS